MSRLQLTMNAYVPTIVDAISPTPMRLRHRGPSNVFPDWTCSIFIWQLADLDPVKRLGVLASSARHVDNILWFGPIEDRAENSQTFLVRVKEPVEDSEPEKLFFDSTTIKCSHQCIAHSRAHNKSAEEEGEMIEPVRTANNSIDSLKWKYHRSLFDGD